MEGRLLPAAAVLLQLCGKDQHSGYTAYTGRLETLRWGETGEALKRTLRKKGGALLGKASWEMSGFERRNSLAWPLPGAATPGLKQVFARILSVQLF